MMVSDTQGNIVTRSESQEIVGIDNSSLGVHTSGGGWPGDLFEAVSKRNNNIDSWVESSEFAHRQTTRLTIKWEIGNRSLNTSEQ
jgi:hypothetical protein